MVAETLSSSATRNGKAAGKPAATPDRAAPGQGLYDSYDRLVPGEIFQGYLKARGLRLVDSDRGLPADLEAEQAAIGAMLIGGAETVLKSLRPVQLVRPLHREILTAGATVAGDGNYGRVDIVTVGSELRTSRTAEEYEAIPEYLVALVEACPSAANTANYCAAIARCHRLRCLAWMAEQVREAVNQRADVPAIIEAVRSVASSVELFGHASIEAIFAEVNRD